MLFQNGLDIVVIARPTAKDKSYQEIESALLHVGERLHIMTEKNNGEETSD
jgi:ribonuclease P protein component